VGQKWYQSEGLLEGGGGGHNLFEIFAAHHLVGSKE
jgi:hypothetical protein